MCPNCKKPMVVLELEGVEVDRWPRVRGHVLDAGEIELVLSLRGASTERVVRSWSPRPAGRAARGGVPAAAGKLRTFKAGKDKTVDLDRCPRGHGLWFDARELEGVVSFGARRGASRGAVLF